MRILITGASGSGTTTLASALAARLACVHFDLDGYYWLATDPPYRQKRDARERLELLSRDLPTAPSAVASGSLVGWGAEVEDAFQLIVFLYVAAEVRLPRLQQREIDRQGAADPAFLQWASQYDDGPPAGRSLAKHLAWLLQRSSPVLRIEGDVSVERRLELVMEAIERAGP